MERFKLRFHREQQEAPGYALVIAKGGLKLKEATGETESPYPDFAERAMVFRGKSTLDELAKWLSSYLTLPIANKTGLTGIYEYEFRRPQITGGQRGEGTAPGVPPSPEERAPAYSEALENQWDSASRARRSRSKRW